MFAFFHKPAISQQSADWIVSCYEWALAHFDRQAFYNNSQLVTPSPEFFPKQVNSPEQMAHYMFERVVTLSGLEHWPVGLRDVSQQGFLSPPQNLGLEVNKRYVDTVKSDNSQVAIEVGYIREQLKKPQDLTATFAHALAQHVVFQSGIQPPDGPEFFAQSTEVLAAFMGFGLLLANSAYTYRGGCGTCYDPMANRTAAFSESETVFCLAVYCKLKKIDRRHVFTYLKKHLRATYKSSIRQIEQGNYALFSEASNAGELWDQVSKKK